MCRFEGSRCERLLKDGFVCVQPWAGLVIGLLSGLFYVASSKFILNVLKVDDPLDAVAVHGFCGFWGLIAASLFAAEVPTATSYGLEDYGTRLDPLCCPA